MDMDLSQFSQMFFEECLESLESVEKTLLSLDVLSYSDDDINLIFRGMHSIKGGSATFGFSDISEFTHTVETYMDDVRNRIRSLTPQTIDLLLKAVDASRAMILKHQGDVNQDVSIVDNLHEQFKLLNQEEKSPKSVTIDTAIGQGQEMAEDIVHNWYIYFKPQPNMMQKGNDSLRMLSELNKLGTCITMADTRYLPDWDNYVPETSYLAWHIAINTIKTSQEIQAEIFDWVIGECELVFTPLDNEIKDFEELLNLANKNYPPIETTPKKENQNLLESTLKVAEKPEETSKPEQNTSTTKEKPSEKNPKPATAPTTEATSIRVATDKVDTIINLVGELVITQAILQQRIKGSEENKDDNGLKECLLQFSQNIRELQQSVMLIRMLPISNVFSRFPRMVRDMTQGIGKKVELKLLGENTELDKTVLEKIGDPLVHLVRNSLDHGIEDVETRIKRGKTEFGTLILNAYHQGSNIIIDVTDDGNGLNTERIRQKALEKGLITPEQSLTDKEINELIFLPGFSTAEVITDISGRGVGMDVVKKNIQMVGGSISIDSSPGEGSTFSIRLPLTLSIIDGQILKVAQQTFIFPLNSIIEIIQIKSQQVSHVGEENEVYFLRNKYIPIIHLTDVFKINSSLHELEGRFLVIIETNHLYYGIVVDDLLAQQQIVIKNIESNYQHIDGIAGATVLGDGTVALIVDVAALVYLAAKDGHLDKKQAKEKVHHE